MRTRTCRGARESTSIAPAVISGKSSTRHGDRVSPHGVSCGRSERQYGRRRVLCYHERPVKNSETEHRGDRRHRAARSCAHTAAPRGVAAPHSCVRALPSAYHCAGPCSHAPGSSVGTPAPPVAVGGALRAGSVRVCVAKWPAAAAPLCSPAAPRVRPGLLAVHTTPMRRASRCVLRVLPSPTPPPFRRHRRHDDAWFREGGYTRFPTIPFVGWPKRRFRWASRRRPCADGARRAACGVRRAACGVRQGCRGRTSRARSSRCVLLWLSA